MRENQVHIVIPEGTKVLTAPGGRLGVVSHAPDAPENDYCVRFADGREDSFRRSDLTIFKHVQSEVPNRIDSAVFPAGRSVRSAGPRADGSAAYLSLEVRSSHLQRIRALTIQEA